MKACAPQTSQRSAVVSGRCALGRDWAAACSAASAIGSATAGVDV